MAQGQKSGEGSGESCFLLSGGEGSRRQQQRGRDVIADILWLVRCQCRCCAAFNLRAHCAQLPPAPRQQQPQANRIAFELNTDVRSAFATTIYSDRLTK